jgi:hypothetical protein
MKEAKARKPFLDCVLLYMQSFQKERLLDSRISSIFADHVDKLIPALFVTQKKSPSTKEELDIVRDIVLDMAKRKIECMEHKHLQLVMRSPTNGDYSVDQKGIILKIMTILDTENSAEVNLQLYAFLPL